MVSGGTDKLVLVWSLKDAATSLAKSAPAESDAEPRRGPCQRLQPRYVLRGHSDTVESVACHPGQAHQLVSGGDDRCLLFWDTRSSTSVPPRCHSASSPIHDCRVSQLTQASIAARTALLPRQSE